MKAAIAAALLLCAPIAADARDINAFTVWLFPFLADEPDTIVIPLRPPEPVLWVEVEVVLVRI